MSISDLFVPNPYPLNAGSLVVTGNVNADTVTTNAVLAKTPVSGALSIGANLSGVNSAVFIGQNTTSSVQVQTNLGVTGGVTIMSSGANSIVIDPQGPGDAAIDANASALRIGTTGLSSQILIGNPGKALTLISNSLSLPNIPVATPPYNAPFTMTGTVASFAFTQTYTGALVVGSIRANFFRLGNTVFLSFDSASAPSAAAATSVLTIFPAAGLPAVFTPIHNQLTTCSVNLNGTNVAGVIGVRTDGSVICLPLTAGTFTVAQLAGINDGASMTYWVD